MPDAGRWTGSARSKLRRQSALLGCGIPKSPRAIATASSPSTRDKRRQGHAELPWGHKSQPTGAQDSRFAGNGKPADSGLLPPLVPTRSTQRDGSQCSRAVRCGFRARTAPSQMSRINLECLRLNHQFFRDLKLFRLSSALDTRRRMGCVNTDIAEINMRTSMSLWTSCIGRDCLMSYSGKLRVCGSSSNSKRAGRCANASNSPRDCAPEAATHASATVRSSFTSSSFITEI